MSVASVALSPVYGDYWNGPGRASGHHLVRSDDSIVIYLAVGGSMIPVLVHESDSIASVKLMIQKCNKGFFVKKQKLIFNGKELVRNYSQVRDYGMADGNVLHLVLRLSDVQAIAVRTVCGKEFEFHVQRRRNVGYVKQQIAKRGNGCFDLKDQELFCDGEELDDQRMIDDLCISDDAVIHIFIRKSVKLKAMLVEKALELSIVASEFKEKGDGVAYQEESRSRTPTGESPIVTIDPMRTDFLLQPLNINRKIVLSPVIKQLIDATVKGLERGNCPIRSSEGSGGVYFMQDSSGMNYVSVFKPIDEEPMAVNNPRGLPLSSNGEGLKKGTRVGEGAIREVAAYILDHPRGGPRSMGSDEKGYAGVPPTFMVRCWHRGFHNSVGSEKFGSLQMFMKNRGSCEDIGPRIFPIEEVHKLCVLDIRLANADRHAGNILIREDCEDNRVVLVPIDHGYCLPENFGDCTFEWLYWPQTREPFSPDVVAYINTLDAEKDVALLKFHGWSIPRDCARVLRVSTMLLKKGTKRGLTPFAIGSIMCRETVKKESTIEKMIREAEETMLPGMSELAFLQAFVMIMDRYLDGLSTQVEKAMQKSV